MTSQVDIALSMLDALTDDQLKPYMGQHGPADPQTVGEFRVQLRRELELRLAPARRDVALITFLASAAALAVRLALLPAGKKKERLQDNEANFADIKEANIKETIRDVGSVATEGIASKMVDALTDDQLKPYMAQEGAASRQTVAEFRARLRRELEVKLAPAKRDVLLVSFLASAAALAVRLAAQAAGKTEARLRENEENYPDIGEDVKIAVRKVGAGEIDSDKR